MLIVRENIIKRRMIKVNSPIFHTNNFLVLERMLDDMLDDEIIVRRLEDEIE